MENAALGEKYKEHRKVLEKTFKKYSIIKDSKKEFISPSGNYKLVIVSYDTGEGYWNYTKGIVYDKSGEEIFTIFRNYASFRYRWIEHQNGNEYLLCGEDYQGYVTINLTEKKKYVYFHENGFKGWGFCWIDVKEYDREIDDTIRVEGCYWGAQFEIVEYDFSNPDELPYKEISRHDVDFEEEDDDDEEE